MSFSNQDGDKYFERNVSATHKNDEILNNLDENIKNIITTKNKIKENINNYISEQTKNLLIIIYY